MSIKTSLLIIAHNEERYIAECIASVLHQTKHPDEVVLLVHNSTDRTLEIAEKFPITVIPFNGATGIVAARLEGLNHISGDIILWLDGDCVARDNWVEVVTDILRHGTNALVGSWVKFSGTLLDRLYTLYSRHPYLSGELGVAYWIWSSSCAFWGKDKNFVRDILARSTSLSHTLHLPRNPDDYWVALFMSTRGTLARTSKTWVTHYTKETTMKEMLFRRIESHRNMRAMRAYFEKIKRRDSEINSRSLLP